MFKWWVKHTEDGSETPDPTPSHIPLARPLTLQEQLARFAHAEDLKRVLETRGVDTFDEANDFGPEEPQDDMFPGTPYEMRGMSEDLPVQTRVDEMKSGLVADIPQERKERIQNNLRDAENKRKARENPPAPKSPTA